RQSQTVVVIPLAFQNTIARTLENVRRQLLRRRFSRAARDRNYRSAPCGVDAMREQLQRGDGVVNQQQTILYALQIRVAADMILTSYCSDCATLERVTKKAMGIDNLAVKAGAGIVLLRECKKQFARAYRTRVDGIIIYLFVKYLCANACRIRAHQTC